MIEQSIRSMVESHSCELFATRYSLRVAWLAVQRCAERELLQSLLCIELMAIDGSPASSVRLHLAVWFTRVSEFPAALDDALRVHLFERAMAAAPQRPWTVRLHRWAATARAVGRSPWAATRH